MKIAVFGLGYVGLSNAVLLAQNHTVVAVDVSPQRVDQLNARQSPIVDAELQAFLRERSLDLVATLDADAALAGLLILRVAGKLILSSTIDVGELAGMFFLLAFGMIVPWRIAMYLQYKKLQSRIGAAA